jgi:hypothetical protein
VTKIVDNNLTGNLTGKEEAAFSTIFSSCKSPQFFGSKLDQPDNQSVVIIVGRLEKFKPLLPWLLRSFGFRKEKAAC